MKIKDIKEKYNAIDGSMYGEKNINNHLGLLYHENSKLTRLTSIQQGRKIGGFNNAYVTERSVQPYKMYPGKTIVKLDNSEDPPVNNDFSSILKNRRSGREYDKDYKISLNELSHILYNSYGVSYKEKILNFDLNGHVGFRNLPSAGGLYPLEIYVVMLNGHISSGLYHYRPDINSLEIISERDYTEKMADLITAEPYVQIRNASCIVLITAVVERSIIKYGERGYRFILQESGVVGTGIGLIAESLQLSSCWIGGYLDEELEDFLGIDGVFESINNVLTIGKNKKI